MESITSPLWWSHDSRRATYRRYFFFFLAAFFFAMRDSPPSVGLVAHRFAAQLLGKLSPAPLVVNEIDVELR
jgi:hypothetical protein